MYGVKLLKIKLLENRRKKLPCFISFNSVLAVLCSQLMGVLVGWEGYFLLDPDVLVFHLN